MKRVKLIYWKPEEVEQREKNLRAAGYEVDSKLEGGSKLFKEFTEDPPAALVIDLLKLPSQGRDFG
jgi:hypothetical protein